MCGFAGVFSHAGGPVNRDALARMSDAMVARGPDGAGDWQSDDQRVGLVHRRLSIIELSDLGHQPMVHSSGKAVIAFNGEIYNYEALREGLIGRGHKLVSNSDTEVILALYAEKGEALVHDLRGMFAFAIWDLERRSLFLARDPYGIKPLYYAADGRAIRFASQVKALMAGGEVSTRACAAGWVGFHLMGSVPEPFTVYEAVKALPAGSTMSVSSDGVVQGPTSFASISRVLGDASAEAKTTPPAEHHGRLREALLDSMRHHLVADVPIGLFLSAGIDSGAVLGLLRELSSAPLQTITLVFDEYGNGADDEGELAAEVAAYYGAEHHKRVVTKEEFLADLPAILAAMDQPSVDGINTWFVSKATRELGLKVALSGLGGDELLGGYPTFRLVPKATRLLSRLPGTQTRGREVFERQGPGWIKDEKRRALMSVGGMTEGAYFVRRGVFMPAQLSDVMDPEIVRSGGEALDPVGLVRDALGDIRGSDFAQIAALEASLYMRNQLLRDSDWASMAHSLEVRVPLVDYTLLRESADVLVSPDRALGKSLLADAPQRALPSAITGRRKTGFTTPIADWLQSDPRTQGWRDVATLARPNCRWAQRWAYTVAEMFQPAW